MGVVPLQLLDVLLPGEAVSVGAPPRRIRSAIDAGSVSSQGRIATEHLGTVNELKSFR